MNPRYKTLVRELIGDDAPTERDRLRATVADLLAAAERVTHRLEQHADPVVRELVKYLTVECRRARGEE